MENSRKAYKKCTSVDGEVHNMVTNKGYTIP